MAEYTVVSENSAVYYGHTYWNDIEVVRRELNRRVSGDPDRDWVDHFQATIGSRRFERALMLNCGNGHVERGLLVRGLVAETVGIDCSAELLDEAIRAAADEGLPARYVQLDVNSADFPPGPYDLVVNFSAGHHVQRIDRVLRKACSMLTDDGYLVAYDYVGPHRNQYPWVMWEAAYQANQALPDHLRQDMSYPHLPTMLADDPTEAIHPELIMDVMHRYFVVEEYVPLGGAIGYLLLTHNQRLFAADPAEREKWADEVMSLDAHHLAAHPEHTLFAYWLARPDKRALNRQEELLEWEAEEEEREQTASERGGEYYPRTSLQTLTIDLEDQRQRARRADDLNAELEALRAQVAALTAELGRLAPLIDQGLQAPQLAARLSALEGSPGVRVWSRLGSSRAAGWVRERPKLASVVRRILH
jgi:SAM-dependent methyltransferase